ncbi:phosphoribosylformylglycinamidine cyclo-ligase [Aerococcus loyolae]|uniref:phosphoribosylformylglycinamidine cyclo-ligase n=1 Tax=Aerococcus loyolae TaxID=2976809 RepID=UPI0012476CC6|nr:phosphoribosylformylglycinamidine cyclo-ligase [Aerococcus loyolae]KAA9221112.1 phosphoribosylformylglycinamidine cyclo-ligase [Aerococcus loyolae]
MTNAYQNAGVDVEAGYQAVERIKKQVAKTWRPEVMGAIGSFAGAFSLAGFDYEEPCLLAGTDGVGTKLMLAIQSQRYDSIGIDCVAMCVNDILAQGAQPLFFLDYIAVGKNQPAVIERIVKGVAEGCKQAGAALIGGETAEMPGMYATQDFDLAGFAVGIAEKKRLITPKKVKEGDILLGLASSGLHSNGYSLVRKVFFKDNDFALDSHLEELGFDRSLIDELLIPTRIYVKTLQSLIERSLIHGMAHITGGGFIENIPRILPEGYKAQIQLGSWPVLPIFKALEKYGQLDSMEMLNIFNMGIGMVLAIDSSHIDEVEAILHDQGESTYRIGQVKKASDVKEKNIFEGTL